MISVIVVCHAQEGFFDYYDDEGDDEFMENVVYLKKVTIFQCWFAIRARELKTNDLIHNSISHSFAVIFYTILSNTLNFLYKKNIEK